MIIFFSHKFEILEISSCVYVEVMMGLTHNTLESYGRLRVMSGQRHTIIKAIVLLTDRELMSSKIKQPIEDPKEAGMSSLEF